MLAGEAVIAIWNGIAETAREDFYAWHTNEHMPERVGIPGFLRGRRYAALDAATTPEFFTLYETESFPVVQGQDYANRLNNPTPWTRRVTAQFRATRRSLARVIESRGPGVGGAMLTLGFTAEAAALAPLRALLAEAAAAAGVIGAHLCLTDREASAVRSTESATRTDIADPPGAIILVEAASPGILADMLPRSTLLAAGAPGPFSRGLYRLEYLRGKTAFSA